MGSDDLQARPTARPTGEQRIPLLTPSASPPIQRYSVRQDGVATTKKRTASQTPSLLSSVRSSVSSSSARSATPSSTPFSFPPDPDEALHSARHASSSRVLNVWASLAEKYERRLDEDDIVDLENETLVKDYGVLRSTTDMYGIGCFAEEHDRQLQDDDAVIMDDELDEIDAFADNTDCTSQAETDLEETLELPQSRRLPPVQELDPDDAADLAEFLEAERQRRERFGDPDSEEDAEEPPRKKAVKPGESSRLASPTSSGEEEDSGEEDVDDQVLSNPSNSRSVSILSGSPELDVINYEDEKPENVDSDSAHSTTERQSHWDVDEARSASDPDEIDAWDQDSNSVTYPLVEDQGGYEVDSDDHDALADEEQVLHKMPEKVVKDRHPKNRDVERVVTKKDQERSRNLKVQQLQTPPRSSSYESIENVRKRPEGERKLFIEENASKKDKNRQKRPELLGGNIESAKTNVSKKGPKKISQRVTATAQFNTFPEVVIPVQPSFKEYESTPFGSEFDDNDLVPKVKSSSRKSKGKLADHRELLHDESDKHSVVSSRRAQIVASGPEELTPQREKTKTMHNPKKRRRVSSPKVNNTSDDRGTRRPKTSRSRDVDRGHEELSHSNTCTDSDEDDYESDKRPGPSTPSSARLHFKKQNRDHEDRQHPFPNPSYKRSSSQPRHSSRPRNFDDVRDYETQNQMPYVRSQSLSAGPHFQDPTMHYHLAQALQSLSIIMGGAMPFGPPNGLPHHLDSRSAESSHHANASAHPPWPPYTPHHQRLLATSETPQSAASAPPTSSPLGSEYSDEASSSPTKYSQGYERGRSATASRRSSGTRLKSAIRDSRSRSRSKARLRRRVSFSSPEAVHIEESIEEIVYSDERQLSEESEVYDEDSDNGRRHSKQSTHPHRIVRAQTPGPPDDNSGRGRSRGERKTIREDSHSHTSRQKKRSDSRKRHITSNSSR